MNRGLKCILSGVFFFQTSAVFCQSTTLKQAALRPVVAMSVCSNGLLLARPDGTVTLVDSKSSTLKEFTSTAVGKPLGIASFGGRFCWLTTSEPVDYPNTKTTNTLNWVDVGVEGVNAIDLTGSGNLSRDKLVMPDAERVILIRGSAGMEISLKDSNIKFADPKFMSTLIAAQPNARLIPDVVRESLITNPISVSGSGNDIWAILGKVVVHTNSMSGKSEAYFSWNMKEATVSNLAADEDGAWVFTNNGIRHIEPNKPPDPKIGFDGFVRISYGSERDLPFNSQSTKLGQEMSSWIGARYSFGGISRTTGVDCSGFVMQAYRATGINLEHGSDYLRTCRQGTIVHDELRYGDILVFPGHCAIYAGNGTTMEALDDGVGKHLLYHRSEIVIRRMIDVPQPDINTKTFGSRSQSKKKRG